MRVQGPQTRLLESSGVAHLNVAVPTARFR
jgi:hypothetical protein